MLRAIGPPMSCVLESGTMPVRLDSPCVPRRPTRLLCDAGLRIDPHVSLPMPAAAKLAATAAPVPPLEPPGLRSRSYGFFVCPKREPTVVIPAASSCMLVLAENDRAGGLQPLHLERIASRMERRQRDRASRGRHLDRLVVVLHDHRNAVKRTPRALGGALRIERSGRITRARIDADDRIQRRSAFVVRVDSRQIEINELPGRHRAGLHRALQLLD